MSDMIELDEVTVSVDVISLNADNCDNHDNPALA